MVEALEKKYYKAARIISSAGGTPLPVSDTIIDILKFVITEDDLDFISAFHWKRSQTLEELKKSSKLPEEKIIKKATTLAKIGVMFNQPNSKGVMVYRLLPLVNVGIFEYFFMGKLEINKRNKEIADLFKKLQYELREFIQKEYDTVVPTLLDQPPIDRTLPVFKNIEGTSIKVEINQEIDVPIEKILPTQRVEELVEKFDDIAVGHCFCRHHRDLLGDPCKQTDQRENCFTFGKSARHVSENGFGRLVSKEEALKILKKAEEDDLIHKAYHPNFDINRDETSICNCCSCCCG